MVGVRATLLAKYEALVATYPDRKRWLDRLEAVCAGDTLVEPGWMLRDDLGDAVDPFGLYRVYPDGRVERDRYIERIEVDRFRSAGSSEE